MTTVTTAAPPVPASVQQHDSPRKPRIAIYSVCAIFTFLAFISIVGSLLFSYPLGGLVGYTSGICLDIGGVGMAYCAYKLPRREWATYKLAVGLMVAEFAWCFYKVFIYHETESTMFFVAAVLALVLLVSGPVRRYYTAARP